MFDHVTVRVADRAASERFYETVLDVLGVDLSYRAGPFAEWRNFSLAQVDDAHPVTQHLHVGFVAPSREQVDAFWQAGVAAGHRSDGEPGPRPQYRTDYYGAFLLDPDGNSIEAVHHGNLARAGIIDHVWIRVADLAAARTFYETIALYAGLFLKYEENGHLTFGVGDTASFTLVAAPAPAPTRNLHMAFASDDDAAIAGFHRAATAAGYASNGIAGERPQYHPGYYAAYVRDPDGNNIEVVNHHRA
ncbi:MAG: Glyoxalase/bleomycin resistance protein/dioxygenase [Conexibacter sp.]|nr:Glyoxalase/bleomycin resistance protein/dioxygenase [Conexibacter sp.]